jgi:hypothetical protein
MQYQLKKKKSPGFFTILFDLFMVLITGGLWLVVLAIRYLRANS